MNWLDLFLHGDSGVSAGIETVLLSLLLAFAIGQVIGWVYMGTHVSTSYSASFVASLVVLPVLVALMMTLMAGNLMIAFGLLAVFAVVRFRNVLRDTRDTTYVLWAIVEGMAAGTMRYSTALIGAGCVVAVLIYLRFTEFGVRQRYDAALSVLVPASVPEAREQVEQILRRYSDRTILTSQRKSPDSRDILSYRLRMRDPSRRDELRSKLASSGDIQELSFFLQEDETES